MGVTRSVIRRQEVGLELWVMGGWVGCLKLHLERIGAGEAPELQTVCMVKEVWVGGWR